MVLAILIMIPYVAKSVHLHNKDRHITSLECWAVQVYSMLQ